MAKASEFGGGSGVFHPILPYIMGELLHRLDFDAMMVEEIGSHLSSIFIYGVDSPFMIPTGCRDGLDSGIIKQALGKCKKFIVL